MPSTASRPTFDTASLREANIRNIDLIERAAHLATETHKGQIRKGSPGTPYINHPARVALRLAQLGHRPEIIAAGFLHDVLEDTDTRRETIIETAGEEVARLVCACTQPPGLKFRERSAWTKARLLDAGDELRALIIADKEDNLACIADEIDRHGEQAWTNLGTSRAGKPAAEILANRHRCRRERRRTFRRFQETRPPGIPRQQQTTHNTGVTPTHRTIPACR